MCALSGSAFSQEEHGFAPILNGTGMDGNSLKGCGSHSVGNPASKAKQPGSIISLETGCMCIRTHPQLQRLGTRRRHIKSISFGVAPETAHDTVYFTAVMHLFKLRHPRLRLNKPAYRPAFRLHFKHGKAIQRIHCLQQAVTLHPDAMPGYQIILFHHYILSYIIS